MNSDKATVVLFYGQKNVLLRSQIAALQELSAQLVGAAFSPRPLEVVHATLIGLESSGGISAAKTSGLADYLQRAFSKPLTIQFGGFQDRDYSFQSREERLYERSLSVVGENLVLIGWPVTASSEPTMGLDDIRKGCREYGVDHKYYASEEAMDPDCYMVIGTIDNETNEQATMSLLDQAHMFLHERPVQVVAGTTEIAIAQYDDKELPIDSTQIIKLVDL